MNIEAAPFILSSSNWGFRVEAIDAFEYIMNTKLTLYLRGGETIKLSGIQSKEIYDQIIMYNTTVLKV